MAKPPAQQPDDLSRVLHSWQVEAGDDPQFAHKVWLRLAADRPPRWRTWADSLARLLARPAAASAAVMLFAAIGAGIAEWRQSSVRDERLARLAAEYAQSIDPLLMHGRSAPAAGHDHAP